MKEDSSITIKHPCWVYGQANDVLKALLFRCKSLTPVREHLKKLGISSAEAKEMGLGFCPSNEEGPGHQHNFPRMLQEATGMNLFQISFFALVRETEPGSSQFYNLFNRCLTMPVYFNDGPFYGEVAGIIGVRWDGESLDYPMINSGFGWLERELSDFAAQCETLKGVIIKSALA